MLILRPALIGFVVLVLMVLVGPLYGAQKSLSRASYERLSEIRDLMEEGEFGSAQDQLKMFLEDLGEEYQYDRAVALETLGYAQAQAQEYEKAAVSFQKVISIGVFPLERTQRNRQTLVRIYLNDGRYRKAERAIERWLQLEETREEKARMLALLGFSRLQLAEYAEAVAPLERAVSLREPPEKSWLHSLLKAYLEVENFAKAVLVQKQLIEIAPDKGRYWRNLVSLYMRQGKNSEALAVAGVAYVRNRKEEGRWLRWLAGMYLDQGRPYRAGEILRREIASGRVASNEDNLEMLAYAWGRARERRLAIRALQRVVNKSGDPQYWVRIARHHLALGDWAKMETAAEKALAHSELEDRGRVLLLVGISRFRQQRISDARQAFQKATEVEDVKEQALQWMRYLAVFSETKTESG